MHAKTLLTAGQQVLPLQHRILLARSQVFLAQHQVLLRRAASGCSRMVSGFACTVTGKSNLFTESLHDK